MKWFRRREKVEVPEEAKVDRTTLPYYVDLPAMPARRIYLSEYQAEIFKGIEGYEGLIKENK